MPNIENINLIIADIKANKKLFDMRFWNGEEPTYEEIPCGTIGCIGGFVSRRWEKPEGISYSEYVSEKFGIVFSTASFLCIPLRPLDEISADAAIEALERVRDGAQSHEEIWPWIEKKNRLES